MTTSVRLELIGRRGCILTRLVWLSAEMRVPIRVRLSAVTIVTFSGGVKAHQLLRKAQVRLGHQDGELTVDVLVERHVESVETS